MATTKTPAATPKKPAAKVTKTSTVKKTATAPAEKKVAAPKVTAKATTSKAATTPKAVAKPAVKKAAVSAEKAVAPKVAAVKKVAVKKAVTKKSSPAPSAEERYRMVQDAAYYLAEKNNFKSSAMSYWIAAEREINEFLSGK